MSDGCHMHPDLMGTPRFELAFDQAVSSDFFQLRHLSFCVLPLAWIDQALAPIMAIAFRFLFLVVRWFFVAKLPWIKAQYSRWYVFIFQNTVENGQDKGFLAIKSLRWFPYLTGARRSR